MFYCDPASFWNTFHVFYHRYEDKNRTSGFQMANFCTFVKNAPIFYLKKENSNSFSKSIGYFQFKKDYMALRAIEHLALSHAQISHLGDEEYPLSHNNS